MDIIKPHQQVHQRGLSGAGRPHDGHLLPMAHLYGEIPDQRRFGVIAEIDPVKLHIALYGAGQVPVDGLFLLGVLQFINPPGGGTGTLHRSHHPGDLLQRGGKLPGIQQHRHHGAHPQRALYRQVPADDRH